MAELSIRKSLEYIEMHGYDAFIMSVRCKHDVDIEVADDGETGLIDQELGHKLKSCGEKYG